MTKRQAEQHLREIESEIFRGVYQQPLDQTIEEYLAEWLTHARAGLAESTYGNYALMVRVHINPRLGKYKLDQLTPLHIQRFYAELLTPGSNRNSRQRALSPKSIKNVHCVLHKALAQAVRWGLRVTNPADAVDLPRLIRPETKAITNEELQRLMTAVDDAREWRIPLLIAIGTGMRRGEILALQWQDFNPAQRLLVVRRALSHITTGNVVVKGTKTDKARVVALNDSLVRELDRHRQATAYAKPTDWICTHADGTHLIPHAFTNYAKRLISSVGLDITLHGLRHTHATSLLASGVPVKVISERLGHSSVIITQDIYAHVLPTMQRQAADVMESIWTNGGTPACAPERAAGE
ncbi:MAG: tyrosine-type recombinase/integrase [Armatimonadota bacterium]